MAYFSRLLVFALGVALAAGACTTASNLSVSNVTVSCPLTNNQQTLSKDLILTCKCSKWWRVRNNNNCGVYFTWDAGAGSSSSGSGFVSPSSEVYFQTITDTQARLFVDGTLVASHVSNNGKCSGSELVTSVDTTSQILVEGSQAGIFTIALKASPGSSTTVKLVPDAYSTVSPSTVTFTASNFSTAAVISVTPVDDKVYRGVTASSAISLMCNDNNAVYSTVSATIKDNDAAGVTLSETELELYKLSTEGCNFHSNPNANNGKGHNCGPYQLSDKTLVNYTIVLSSMPSASVKISLSTSSKLDLSSYSVTFTTSNWNVPQTIEISSDPSDTATTQQIYTILSVVSSSDSSFDGLVVPTVIVKVNPSSDSIPASSKPTNPVKLLTTNTSSVSAGISTWLSATFTATANVDNFAITISNLPTNSTVSYPSDRSFTSLFKDDTLSSGETDYVAFKFTAGYQLPTVASTVTLTCTYTWSGVSMSQTFSLTLPYASRSAKPFTVSTASFTMLPSFSAWIALSFTATSAMDNFNLVASNPSPFTVSYPSNKNSSSLSQSSRLDSGATDYASVYLYVPSTVAAGTYPVSFTVSWTESTTKSATIVIPVTIGVTTSSGRRLTSAPRHLIDGSVSLTYSNLGSVPESSTVSLFLNLQGTLSSAAVATVTPASGFTVTHSDGASSKIISDSTTSTSYAVITLQTPAGDACFANGFSVSVVDSGVPSTFTFSLCTVVKDLTLGDEFAVTAAGSTVKQTVNIDSIHDVSSLSVTPSSVPSGMSVSVDTASVPEAITAGSSSYFSLSMTAPSTAGTYTTVFALSYLTADGLPKTVSYSVSGSVTGGASDDDMTVYIIVGAVLGGIFVLSMVSFAVLLLYRHRARTLRVMPASTNNLKTVKAPSAKVIAPVSAYTPAVQPLSQ
eukprot:GILJ01001037.1.p1 GENE.GILJ01001037.1~~GILJ01001037.1.p1  ORF type:complete len:910 (-),score=128.14 GILJ01001037.1:185-2914(-)